MSSDPASPSDLGQLVARSADSAELHAPVPTLLLELQTMLGTLTAIVAQQTGRGRTPFRPDGQWQDRVGELAYGIYLLADQTGVEVSAAVAATANRLAPPEQRRPRPDDGEWPFPEA